MPDLPPSVYIPAFAALGLVVSTLAGAVFWCVKWARSAEREKDAIQDKWIAYQERRLPVQVAQNDLMRRVAKALGGLE